MKTALIPPIDLLNWTSFTNYHLMLPQLLVNRRYEEHYEQLCESENDFVILDNGLAEGHISSTMEMVDFARRYKPDEVVIPDVMCEPLANIARADSFIRDWFDMMPKDEELPGLMFVCQGKNVWDFIASGVWAMSQPAITTVGIPRHALSTCQNLRARSFIANQLQAIQPFEKQIHFLGASPLWSREALYLASWEETDQRCIRGMDTSMPFNYAYAGRHIVSDLAKVSRPSNYFILPGDDFDQNIVAENVYQLFDWCKE